MVQLSFLDLAVEADAATSDVIACAVPRVSLVHPARPAWAPANDDLPDLTGDDVLDELRVHAATGPTFAQRTLAAHLARKREAGLPLQRIATSYDEKAILAEAGIPWEIFIRDAGLRAMLARYASRMKIAEYPVAGGSVDKAGKSFISFVEMQLDEMERLGTRVMRMHAGRDLPSAQWWADYIGVPRSFICNNGLLRNALNKRLKAGTLKLGRVFKDPHKLTKAQLRVLRGKAEAVLAQHEADGRPLVSHPERGDKFWFDRIFDDAGISDPHHRDMLSLNKGFRVRLTRTMDLVGMMPEGAESAKPQRATFASLKDEHGDAIGLVRQDYRRAHPDLEPECPDEQRYVANEVSYLNRARRVNDLGDVDEFDTGDGYQEMRDAGLTASVKGNEIYVKSLDRWRVIAEAVSKAGVFPATFHGALTRAMEMKRMDAATLADAIGAPRRLIHNWRSGRTPPQLTSEHFVIAAEVALGVPDLLTSRLGELSARRAAKGRTHVTLPDGTSVRLSLWWRRLPKGAAGWPDAKLIPELVSALARHGSRKTKASIRIGAAQRNEFGLPEEDPSCPIWTEWEDLVRFKRTVAGDTRHQPLSLAWKSAYTIGANRNYTSIFERWSRLPIELGGLGLEPHQVSFRILLNPAVATRYVVWRATRCADMELDGKPLGVQMASTEKGILTLFSGICDADFGWLTQSGEKLGVPEPIERTFRVPLLVVKGETVEIIDDETCREVAVLSPELVAAIVADWKGAVAATRLELRVLKSNWQLSFKLMRDPKDLVGPIIRHKYPIAVMIRMVREALKRVRRLENSPVRHARDYERILAALLLTLVVFRSETLRELTWRRDNKGQLRWVDGRFEPSLDPEVQAHWIEGHYEVVVDADCFKNLTSWMLFGPSWNRRAYERDLKDWGGLDGILKHYLEVCRPILLDGRESDLLFPPPKPQRGSTEGKTAMTEHDFGYLVKSFTQMWCVHNKRYGTGMPGVFRFGPHVFRDIVATHILIHWPSEDRWELAARILGTGVDQVRSRYGWVNTRRELSAADGIFDEASAIGMSDIPLW